MATAPAITTENLSKHYGKILAVDNLNLTVFRGEIFGFLGPNGAGKSTTMRMLLGLIHPSAGSAQLLGMSVTSQLGAILSRTGSLIESPTFYPFLSGRENLRLVADLTGVGSDRMATVLELVDLEGAADRKYNGYSMGMKQRLGVATALLNEPDLILLDEPTNGLDPAGIVEMRDLMHRLKAEGRTVFISSHVLHEIEQVCDRIAILQQGRVVVQGAVQELLGQGALIQVRVAQAAAAADVLRALPWVTEVTRQDDYLLVAAPVERSADVNEALAGAGLYAAEIRPHEASLERYFLDVTSGAA